MPIDLPGGLGEIDVPLNWRKPCRAGSWNDGVRPIVVPPLPLPHHYVFQDIPFGLVSDGQGGAFVLSVGVESWETGQSVMNLAHISGSGLATPPLQLTDPDVWSEGALGINSEGAIVRSGAGRVLLAENDPAKLLSVRRFDARLSPLWRGVRVLDGSGPRGGLGGSSRICLIGESDIDEGGLFAWHGASQTDPEARVQSVTASGGVRWGSGTVVGTVPFAPTFSLRSCIQLVATGDGGAIVVLPQTTGATFSYVATPVDVAGTAGPPATLVTGATDDWRSRQRLRLAVSDSASGLFLAYTDAAGQMRLLRYWTPQGVLWDIAVATPGDPRAFYVHEDGVGGVLVAWLEPPRRGLRVRRYDPIGGVTWDTGTAAGNTRVEIALPRSASAWVRDAWARLVHVLPDGSGGAIVVFQQFPGAFRPAIMRMCIDASGVAGDAEAVTSRATAQTFPLADAAGGESAVVAWGDDAEAATEGMHVFVQRVTCCRLAEPPPTPPFGCEIVPLPGTGPGEFTLSLPCGNESRRFGVIALSRFAEQIPALAAPGVLRSHDADAPEWTRLTFAGAGDSLSISLVTLAGDHVADAVVVAGSTRVLTFAPRRDEDLLLVLRHDAKLAPDAMLAMSVTAAYGDGRPPKLPRAVKRAPKL